MRLEWQTSRESVRRIDKESQGSAKGFHITLNHKKTPVRKILSPFNYKEIDQRLSNMWIIIWSGDSHTSTWIKVSPPPRTTLFPLTQTRVGRGSHSIWNWTSENWKVTHSNHRHKILAATGTFECHLNILWFWRIIPFPRTSKVQAHYMPYIFQKT